MILISSSLPIQRARFTFRLVFISSFLALGLDWTRDVHPLTVHAIWTDLLGYIGSMGYVASSALTLTVRDVFDQAHPRSLDADYQNTPRSAPLGQQSHSRCHLLVQLRNGPPVTPFVQNRTVQVHGSTRDKSLRSDVRTLLTDQLSHTGTCHHSQQWWNGWSGLQNPTHVFRSVNFLHWF